MTEIVDQTDNNVGEYVFTWITYKDDIPRFMYQLFNNESLVDVTLCVAGERIQAHRLILGACSDLFRAEGVTYTEEVEQISTVKEEEVKPEKKKSNKTKRKRENAKRDYNPANMEAALNDLSQGLSLVEASTKNNVARSTLYMRCKALGMQLNTSRHDYPAERLKAAINAVMRKLPESFWKKRKTEDEHIKKMRLEEAVTACLQGKMSQAAASVAYHIPKTTIWRRLQQEQRKMDKNFATKRRVRSIQQADVKVESLKDSELTMCNDSSDIPMTYINENNVEESIIILTKEEVEGLNLDDSQQIIVSTDNDGEYIPCSINIEDTSNYSAIES
ncbi:hypothetical protein G9C98_006483 [Cotesia typhae]|uniref:BTB domain-containing protein n=1 Tax=Cotesia typhae TaxID=2053667 RepID=A0A8J5QQ24_9HYME|nr:hypothetical protein G9C98_006483 [Cotesia typhae]